MSNFMTREDLNRISGLLSYLNNSFTNEALDATVVLGDSNGEKLGTIEMTDRGYVFTF